MNQMNLDDYLKKETTTNDNCTTQSSSFTSLSSSSSISSTSNKFQADNIKSDILSSSDKPNPYFKYKPSEDDQKLEQNQQAESEKTSTLANESIVSDPIRRKVRGASNFLNDPESDDDFEDLSAKLMTNIKNTVENQLIKNSNLNSTCSILQSSSSSTYKQSANQTVNSTLFSVNNDIDKDIDDDDASSTSSSSSSSSTSSSSSSSNPNKSINSYKKIINNIKSTLSTTQEIITNFKNENNNSQINDITSSLESSKLKIDLPKATFSNNISQDNTNPNNTSLTSSTANHFVFKDRNNSNKILDGLNKLRLSRSNYDIILVSNDGQEFCCHKCVLVSFSSYFNAMFNLELAESKQSSISLSSLDSQTMGLIIDYAYTSNLTINDNNVQSLLTAANLLDIKPVKDAACRYMEWNMEDTNAIGIFEFSDTHNCDDLKKISFKYILSNFTKIIEFDEFLSLQRNKLIEIISDDNLNVTSEETVYIAAMKWLKHSAEERSKDFFDILKHIRLNLLSPYFLFDHVESDKYIKTCNQCCSLVREALMYNLLKDRRNQIQNERTKSRKSFQHLEALIIIGGEDDSVVLRSVDSYFPAIDRWVPLQCSPYALSKHGIVSSGEQTSIFMAGGEWPDANPNDTFWQFNSILDDWKELCSLQIPRSELGLTIVDNYVYAIGGWTGSERLDSVEKYDPLLNTWKYCASMKMAISSPGVCSLGGLLYVIGGSVLDGEVTNQVQVYNPSHDEWKFVKSMETARTGCGSCAFNSKIYALGGWESSNESLNLVECYDPETNLWESCPNMISCRHKPGVAVLLSKIYVAGGEALFNCYHDSIEAFDIEKQQWYLVTLMNSGRSWLSCATLRLQNPLIDTTNETNNESIKN